VTTTSQRTDVKEFEESLLQIDRVSKVVKGGKILRFRLLLLLEIRREELEWVSERQEKFPLQCKKQPTMQK